jgi:two-component system response regulator YesN
MRIMVVEDEDLLRQGLINMIERMKLPCSVVASSADGEDALEQLAYIGIDLIITDIRMPKMDGLQLLGEVSVLYPEIRSIILSGYDDFEYAKKAMKLNCQDYLLKPFIYSELYELLDKISKDISSAQAKILVALRQKGIINQNQYFIRHEFLRNFIHRSRQPQIDILIEEAAQIGIALRETSYFVVVIQFEDKQRLQHNYEKNDWTLMKYAVHNVIEEMMGYSPCFYDEEELLIVLSDDVKELHHLLTICSDIQMKINELFKLGISIGVSNIQELANISTGYKEAKKTLKYRLISDSNIILSFQNVSAFNGVPIKSLLEPLAYLFELDDAEIVQKRLKEWYERLTNEKLSWDSIVAIEKELKVVFPALLTHFVKKLGDESLSAQLGTEIDIIEYSDSFYTRMHPIMKMLTEISSHSKKGKIESHTSDQVMTYMKEHFRGNITLTSIAEHIYMNPAYLSVMFKRKTGKSIIEVLTEIRMEEAKRLLLDSDYKTYQIAEMIGYNDAAYFSNAFKKFHAVSPQDFRKSNHR